MRHRINEWIQRLVVPILAIAAFVLLRIGFNLSRILLILGSFLIAAMLAMVLVDPGPRTKGFVEGIKSRFR
jgi:hypothetical protein